MLKEAVDDVSDCNYLSIKTLILAYKCLFKSKVMTFALILELVSSIKDLKPNSFSSIFTEFEGQCKTNSKHQWQSRWFLPTPKVR